MYKKLYTPKTITKTNTYDDMSKSLSIMKRLSTPNKTILKEDELKYPSLEKDIEESIENFKTEMSGYAITLPNDPLKVYDNKNVIFRGFVRIKEINIEWEYSMLEDGVLVQLNKDRLPLYNEIVNFLKDFKEYYTKWKLYWTDKLNDVNQ